MIFAFFLGLDGKLKFAVVWMLTISSLNSSFFLVAHRGCLIYPVKDLNDYHHYVGEGEIIQGTVGGVKPADTLLQFLTRQSLENVTQLVLIITFIYL